MEPQQNVAPAPGADGSGDVSIAGLNFQGRAVSSPSRRWQLAIESVASGQRARWALLDGGGVHASGSTETAQVQAAALADDATFVLARRTGRVETTVDVHEGGGQVIFSTKVEALANSAAISTTGRWVAVGFVDAKRGDEPVVLIDADKRQLFRRIPASGSDVRCVDEERRVVVTEDGELGFGEAAPPLLQRRPGDYEAPLAGGAGSPMAWGLSTPVQVQTVNQSPFLWFALVLGALGVVYVAHFLIVALFISRVPVFAKEIVSEAGRSAVQEYDMAARHGSQADKCRLAARAAEFFLETHNEREYAHWKQVQTEDCSK